jgi:hypothetical protein
MVDQESGTYRPRRAFVEPEPAPPPPPAAIPGPPSVEEPRNVPPTGLKRPTPDFVDEDAPKPLYRDEYAPRPLYQNEPAETGQEMSDDTAGRSITFAPRQRRTNDDTTAILTRANTATGRSRNGRAGPGLADDIDDFDSDEERKPLGERTRWAIALGAVAAVVVVGLAIGYAVLRVGDQQGTVPAPSLTAGTGATAPSTGTTGDPSPTTGGVLLSEDSMLTAAQAKRLDSKRTWEVVNTQRGADPEAPVAACFGAEPEDGQPVSQQKILRVLSSSGKSAPSALHEATAYATPEEAFQAFNVASRTLGTCAAAGAWLAAGQTVRGVGDQSVSAIVAVLDGKSTSWHSVIVSRTGRVLNVLDASRPAKAIPMKDPAAALAEVTDKQCTATGGKCAGNVQAKPGPPPLGGDEPGFLASGDLPPVAGSLTPWNAAPIDLPDEDFPGASCETINWNTVPAENRKMRIYLQPDSGKSYFGVNEILLITKDAKAATALVDKIKKDLETCKERRLTATVGDPKKVSGIGARNTEVSGYTAVVEQKTSDGTDKFRVGIVATGSKVVYTFANPSGDFDFTDSQWNTIAVRAGERVTQVTT